MTDEARFGISALDLSHSDVAENDELMVEGLSGRMYYKRPDGTIVTYNDGDFSPTELLTEIDLVTRDKNIDIADTDYISYHTIDISGMTDILSNGDMSLQTNSESFPVASPENYFFVRVRGNKATTAITSVIENNFKSKSSDDTKSIRLIYRVVAVTATNNYTDNADHTIELNFNELASVELPVITGVSGTILKYLVYIRAISFDGFVSKYGELTSAQQTAVTAYMKDATKYEATTIDVISFINDFADIIIHKKSSTTQEIVYVTPATDVTTKVARLHIPDVVISSVTPADSGVFAKPMVERIPVEPEEIEPDPE